MISKKSPSDSIYVHRRELSSRSKFHTFQQLIDENYPCYPWDRTIEDFDPPVITEIVDSLRILKKRETVGKSKSTPLMIDIH